MSDVGDRIRQARKRAGLSQEALANEVGVTKSAVSQWEKGPTQNLKMRHLYAAARATGEDPRYLATGRREGVQESPGGYGTGRYGAQVAPGPDVHGPVPLISWVQAGEFHEAHDPYLPGDGEMDIPSLKPHGPRAYALRVIGASMWNPSGPPTYSEGDIIIVDPDQAGGAGNNDRVIAKLIDSTDHEVTFKQLVKEAGYTFLRPLNPQYPPVTRPFEVLGKVIGKWGE